MQNESGFVAAAKLFEQLILAPVDRFDRGDAWPRLSGLAQISAYAQNERAFRTDLPDVPDRRAAYGHQLPRRRAKRDVPRAEKLMLEHLEQIESSMNPAGDTKEVDLAAIFQD